MFSSIFSTAPPVDPKASNFHPLTENVKDGVYYGPLTPKDTEWLCTTSGFTAETQTFYVNTDDNKSIMCQVIHSSVGLWYPQIQFNAKVYDSADKSKVWKTINLSNFVVAPSGLDKRSCKSDQGSITHKETGDPAYPESYTIDANLDVDLQLHIEFKRPAAIPGWKAGAGEKGGYSYFGADVQNPDGYVIHRIFPRLETTGHYVSKGAMKTFSGAGFFVHAIQGMRPNLVASSWNFANFQSKDGTSAVQMEFTTTSDYGKHGAGSGHVKVIVGSLVHDGKLVCVTAQTHYPGESSEGDVRCSATHSKTFKDADTSYNAPQEVIHEFAGPSLLPDAPGTASAKLVVDLGADATKGLIEKVDFLAEVPYVIKMAVNYVAGTKPFIYQWYNPSTKLSLTLPGASPIEVEGSFYNEASFLSV
ncbi:oxidative stress survival, Svf1-like protein [Cylindrobasidium torrendii FP15055 ss-10]|uniref:Oxidative stress survival, Svf1-like protein n=1 Tax=Cylindrobasidium torrendii FP15055 ss-10 TaxID=1314674 RepID=A0A0D7BMU4_9AGAR|nr:oxidative stress survival, Svf1-like protein [Cylindrobasidium torrendii FP15055 ss-10]